VKNVYVISDNEDKIKGGIENHAKILASELEKNCFTVFKIDYSKFKLMRFREDSVIIVEGIHRYRLLKITLTLMISPRKFKLYIYPWVFLLSLAF